MTILETLSQRLRAAMGRLLARLLLLLASTWRVEPLGGLELASGDGSPRLVGFWHGKYLPLLPLLRGTRGAVLVGEGVRGEMIAAICEWFGYTPVLLPHGDPQRAIALMREALSSHDICATPVDGPHGPAHEPKLALLHVAALLGVELVPVSVRATPCFVFWWRWDRREVPLPFARVELVAGPAIDVSAGSPAEFDRKQRLIADALEELDVDHAATARALPGV